MQRDDLLRHYDAEMRADPAAEAGLRYERDDRCVRAWSDCDCCVLFSDFSRRGRTSGTDDANVDADLADEVDAVIAEQVRLARDAGVPIEWKLFGHDRPPGLADRLAAAGFVADSPETLLVFDLAALASETASGSTTAVPSSAISSGASSPFPESYIVRRVTDAAGLRDYAAASEAAFDEPDEGRMSAYAARLDDPTLQLLVVYATGEPGRANGAGRGARHLAALDPVAAARLELPAGRAFASLWGGGVAPAHRGRGLYRALVQLRAREACARGARYLTVDARETSRPILERLGFVALTSVRAWVFQP